MLITLVILNDQIFLGNPRQVELKLSIIFHIIARNLQRQYCILFHHSWAVCGPFDACLSQITWIDDGLSGFADSNQETCFSYNSSFDSLCMSAEEHCVINYTSRVNIRSRRLQMSHWHCTLELPNCIMMWVLPNKPRLQYMRTTQRASGGVSLGT